MLGAMKDTTRDRLARLDRAARPAAGAVREQAEQLHALRAELAGVGEAAAAAHQMARTADDHALELRDLVVSLHHRMEALEELVLTVAAHVGAVDRRNVDYDRWTAQIVQRTLGPADSAVDVGAHSGLILRTILEAAPEGRHLAFEPLPHLAEGLRRDFPGVEVHEVALADAEGEVEFHHVTTNPSYSGLRARELDGPEEVEVIRVRTARLDDVVDPELPVRLLKVDVEGGELGVLRGAPRLLARRRPVTVFELGRGAAGAYGTTAGDVFDLFAGHDMAVSRLDAHLAGEAPLSRDELDHHYATGDQYYFVAHPA